MNAEDKNVLMSSIFKSYEKANFDEIFIKLIDVHLKKPENSNFYFLSNQQSNSPSKHHENVKYFLKNLSLYHKAFYPVTYFDSEPTTKAQLNNSLLDRLLSAVQILEVFTCSSQADNSTTTMQTNPP